MVDAKILRSISRHLLGHNETIAVAESVTSGMIQNVLSQAEDATQIFQGGITAYNIGQKCRQLHIDPIHAMACNCVSEKIAAEMAKSASKMFLSDWGIGITGYAAPIPDTKKLYACYAFVCKSEILQTAVVEAEDNGMEKVQQFYTQHVLEQLVELFKKQL